MKNNTPQNETVSALGSSDLLLADRVEQELRREIADWRGLPGSRLPQQHALADKYGVSLKTIRHALSRLKQDNLIQSTRGRGTFLAPAKKQSTSVLVFCDDTYHAYSIVGGGVVCSVLKDRGYRPNLVVSKHPEEEWEALSSHREEIFGGILIGSFTPETVCSLIEKSKVPLVYIGDMNVATWEPAMCDNVVPDNRALAYRATEYLIRQGHRKIAIMGWGLSTVWGSHVNQGHRDALAKHGLSYDPELFLDFPPIPFDQNKDGIYHLPLGELQQRIDRSFEREEPPTAMLHFSGSEPQIRDILHFYFHDRFKEDSVLVTTYQEILQATYTGYGQATAVCMKLRNLAERAVELLFRDRKGKVIPIRETQEQIYFYQRHNGSWEESGK